MAGERTDSSGQVVLNLGLWGGALDRNPVGIHPKEHENPADTLGRQRFFYSAISELASGSWLFTEYWFKGGPMDTVVSEFTNSLDEAVDMKQMTEEDRLELKDAYKERAIAFLSMEGLASLAKHCDGSFAGMVDRMPQELVKDAYGWTEDRSAMIASDPAIGWPLNWIRDCADNGTLLELNWLAKKKGGSIDLETFKMTMARDMAKDPVWIKYCQDNQIPLGIEEKLVKIAYDYWTLEDLPEVHRRIYEKYKSWVDVNGRLPEEGKGEIEYFSGARVITDKSRTINHFLKPERPDMGVLPYDNVYWSNLDNPEGVIRSKHAFGTLDPAILQSVHDFLTYKDKQFPVKDDDSPDKSYGMAGRIPSEISIKDMKRFVKVWDCFIGGSQGTAMADFTKFGEGLDALCNLYSTIPHMEDVVGWMVGEILYAKTKALMVNSGREGFADQIFKMLQLGDEDTPKELQQAAGGVLGGEGMGTFGAIGAAVGKYELRIGTPHYNEAIAILKTGLAKGAMAGRYLLVFTSVINRIGQTKSRKR
ncbi:MAG: hypothetical protein WC596_03460 [Candidatus Shapirobacteria bacterium]